VATVYVATSLASDQNHNTLVLGNIEVVLPMEEDEEGVPNKPDCVRLRCEDGSYRSELAAGSPGVEHDGDNPLNYYHFLGMPAGRYTVEVRTGEQWNTILRGLDISHKGAFVDGVSWEASTDGGVLGTPECDDADELPDMDEPDCGNC